MSDFGTEVAVWVAKVQKRLDNTTRDICLAVGGSLINKSPIGDPSLWAHPSPPYAYPKGYIPGHFISQWKGSLDEIDYTVDDEIDESGEGSLLNIAKALESAYLPGHIFYITNSLPYAKRLEDGYSTQAPAGMVALTVAEFQGIVKNAVLKNVTSG